MQASATDVFVSYKAEDRPRLKPLVVALEAEGFSVWWDAHIGSGTNWHQDIEQHLEGAKCVLVAWSKRSVGPDGHFVRDEARRAQRRGAYLPVCIDGVEPPLGFGEIQSSSLKGWHGDRSDPRFQGVVHAIRGHVSGEHGVHPHGAGHVPFHEPRVSRRTIMLGGGSVAAIAIVGGSAWELLKPAPANAKRIAVLPFANLSGDPAQVYLAEGIAEELRSALSRVGMQVIGRTSSDAIKDMDAKAAAAKLNVANVLTGSVRRSPETIRIDAQLVSGSDGVERWSEAYDRPAGDVLKIQTDIAENVASALRVALGQAGRAALSLGGTNDNVAQDLILQSRKVDRQSASADTTRKGIDLANAAITRDPNYADAYVEKANMLAALATNYAPTPAEIASEVAEADAAAQKAVALAPGLGSAHMALASIALGRVDYPTCLRETREALALSPQDPDVLAKGAQFLTYFVGAGEGVRLADEGIALDPLNARLYRYKCEALTFARQYLEAIDTGRKALALAPDIHNTHAFVGDAFLLLGQPTQAKAEYEALEADNPFRLVRLALLAARTGDRVGAERMVAQAKQREGDTASYQYAEIYAQLGDRDRAFSEFENAVETKDSGLAYLAKDPFLDPIRSDPRYAALLRRLNFP